MDHGAFEFKCEAELEAARQRVELLEKERKKVVRQIAELIKEIGTTPTPRQLKLHLDLDARKMREICYGGTGTKSDPYNILISEAKEIILREEGLIVGFGRMEEASKELKEAYCNTPK